MTSASRRSGPRCHIGKGAASISADSALDRIAEPRRLAAQPRDLRLAVGRVEQPQIELAGRIGRPAAHAEHPLGAGHPQRAGEAAGRSLRGDDIGAQRCVVLGGQPTALARAEQIVERTRRRRQPEPVGQPRVRLDPAVGKHADRQRRCPLEQPGEPPQLGDRRRRLGATTQADYGRDDRGGQPQGQHDRDERGVDRGKLDHGRGRNDIAACLAARWRLLNHFRRGTALDREGTTQSGSLPEALHSLHIVIPDLIRDPSRGLERVERWIPAFAGMTETWWLRIDPKRFGGGFGRGHILIASGCCPTSDAVTGISVARTPRSADK